MKGICIDSFDSVTSSIKFWFIHTTIWLVINTVIENTNDVWNREFVIVVKLNNIDEATIVCRAVFVKVIYL
jgi:hypothetical protein